MSTHYLPAFTVAGSEGTQRSACGQLVYPAAHSPEPECAACQRWIDALAAPVTTSVLVRQRVFLPLQDVWHVTDWSMSHATADQFEPGILTITAEDGTVLRTFQPESWESVTVFGSDGYPDFSFRNDPAWASHVEGRRLRRRSA